MDDVSTDAGFSIGQVAQRTGLSVHALRLYERADVLAGDVRRDPGGRRVYSDWDVEWLMNCVLFRASGMPLATISRLAQLVREGSGNEAERLDLLRAHQRHILEQAAQLRNAQALVDRKVAAYEQHLAAGAAGDPW
jgi:DNA-binding transcriptional MerR regulator